QDLRALFNTAIKRHADLPRPRKHIWVFDSCFVIQMVFIEGCDPLDDVQCITMEISCPVKPTEVVKTFCIDNERFAFPTSVGPAHPTIGRRFRLISHINRAQRTGKFKDHHDLLCTLEYLKRIRHVHRARNAGQVAFRFWVQSHPVCKILLLFLKRLRLVWNRSTFNNAEAGSNRVSRSQLPEWTWRGGVSCQDPNRFISRARNTT